MVVDLISGGEARLWRAIIRYFVGMVVLGRVYKTLLIIETIMAFGHVGSRT